MIFNNLTNQSVLIVGGTSGIGFATAKLAHKLGANVHLTGRHAKRAENRAREIGTTVVGYPLDIDYGDQVRALFEKLTQIDHVYIAAGSTSLGGVLEGELEAHLSSFHTRLTGSLRVVRALVPIINAGGSVTFTGGVSTDRPIAGAWVSGLGTSAAEQLARVLVMEFPHIRFNAISPGYTDTPMWDKILGDNKQSVLTDVAQKLPVKKIATPEEVASAIIFMMINPSVTGEILHIDGGARLI